MSNYQFEVWAKITFNPTKTTTKVFTSDECYSQCHQAIDNYIDLYKGEDDKPYFEIIHTKDYKVR
jgi:hypothetical protein